MKLDFPVRQEQISKRAHKIWGQCGRMAGHEIEHRIRAEGVRTEI